MAQALPAGLENAFHQAYISDLLSYPLDRLHKEPELLSVDAERISRQMQEVAVGHYRAFITAAESLQFITTEVASIDQHLESLIAEIPKLTSGCNEFLDSAQQILEKRKLNRTLLVNHSTLLDLLEIPQLMDTCVRNGNYDEALDLEAFVAKLATMHMRLPVIQSLVADVRQNTQSLLSQLLQRLRSNIQVPECLRIIGYLRRLGVFNDLELRLQFLKCREAWLAGLLDDLDQGSPYIYLKGMTECHRVNIHDVVTQYRAIFSDDTSEPSDGGLLFSWATHRVTCLLDTLCELLPSVTEGASLALILDVCMYCGVSLGRVGLDFRGLLPPIFESCVYDLFVRNMSFASQNFQHMLDTHRWVPLPSVRLSSRDSEDKNAPPQSLIEHPPLAVFLNGILAALNELRLCAPLSLANRLALELQKTLSGASDSLVRHYSTRILKDSETNLFLSSCRAYLEVASPYCVACFTRCFPTATIDPKACSEGLRKLVTSMSVQNGSARVSSPTRLRSVPGVIDNIISDASANGGSAEEGNADV